MLMRFCPRSELRVLRSEVRGPTSGVCSKKCGPGQPPRPHLLVNVLSCLVHRAKAMKLVRGTRPRRNTLLLNGLRICDSQRVGSQRTGPAEARLLKAATPWVFQKAPKRIPEISPGNSPSRTAGFRQPLLLGRALRTSHACTLSTLRQAARTRNRELTAGCAETVEERDCLWKALEKRDETG